MELILPEIGEVLGRLVLEQSQPGGQAYRIQLEICENPVCECNLVTLHCSPEGPVEGVASPTPVSLEMDLAECTLDFSEADPASDLARAVMQEISPEQWQTLREHYYRAKVLFTERANLDEIETYFPPEAAEGEMVGYYEILPFARPLNITVDGIQWAFDDQYCVQKDCSCRAAVLQYDLTARQDVGSADEGASLAFRYHYTTRRVEVLQKSGRALLPRTALEATREVLPDFDVFLARRHAQLRHLHSLFRKRERAEGYSRDAIANAPEATWDWPAEPVQGGQKPGRNDACPCGSGRKYKKCCGAN